MAQNTQTVTFKPLASNDDAEEVLAGGSGTIGSITLQSSDLELGFDRSIKQMVGIRFPQINIPKNALIQSAYIQFTASGQTGAVAGAVAIAAELSSNAAPFERVNNNITSRPKTTQSINWSSNTNASWGSGGTAGADQRSPNIASLLNTVIAQQNWAIGNAVAFMFSGDGSRNPFSFDGATAPSAVPTLIVTYTVEGPGSFPITTNSGWKYLDNGVDMGTAWYAEDFDDASWKTGHGILGYGDGQPTLLSYGSNSAQKYPTYYFRKKISIPDLSQVADELMLKLLRDDGAVIYVNGKEVLRDNMKAGTITYADYSASTIDGAEEDTYAEFKLNKTILQQGINTIAVELHQRSAGSSDISFDLSLESFFEPPAPVNCVEVPAMHISSYKSVLPSAQPDTLRLPSTHTFQMLMQQGTPYTDASKGVFHGSADFTGYVPINGSSKNGYLSVNHETSSDATAGASILDLQFDDNSRTWQVTNSVPVDFSQAMYTRRNCSGTVTPWNTIITCEEALTGLDNNNDGYQDIGWCVEIDPATKQIKDYDGDGKPDKLFKMGMMLHENTVIAADRKTAYEGNDDSQGYLFKFVADKAEKLNEGKLYVLQLSGGNPSTSTEGTWIQVPNSTPTECNNVVAYATSVGATNFTNIEDVEIGPVDSLVYFTSKSASSVYRFKDKGTSVSDFSIFVGNSSYTVPIAHADGVANEKWGGGNDNLTFDEFNNLYVLQDGGNNHIWMVRPCHTPSAPAIELFAVTPAGSEPTGMTFSPDHKFMFLSIQHPNGTNASVVEDAAGNTVKFNRHATLVVARKEYLGQLTTLPIKLLNFGARKTDNGEVKIDWTYTSTDNQVTFELERMGDVGQFKNIHKQELSNIKGEQRQLSFIDKHAAAGNNFYRLKTTDVQGAVNYSTVVLVKLSKLDQGGQLKIYPNPVKNTATINFYGKSATRAALSVTDLAGRIVFSNTVEMHEGNNVLNQDLGRLPVGTYVLTLRSAVQNDSIKFVKQ